MEDKLSKEDFGEIIRILTKKSDFKFMEDYRKTIFEIYKKRQFRCPECRRLAGIDELDYASQVYQSDVYCKDHAELDPLKSDRNKFSDLKFSKHEVPDVSVDQEHAIHINAIKAIINVPGSIDDDCKISNFMKIRVFDLANTHDANTPCTEVIVQTDDPKIPAIRLSFLKDLGVCIHKNISDDTPGEQWEWVHNTCPGIGVVNKF